MARMPTLRGQFFQVEMPISRQLSSTGMPDLELHCLSGMLTSEMHCAAAMPSSGAHSLEEIMLTSMGQSLAMMSISNYQVSIT